MTVKNDEMITPRYPPGFLTPQQIEEFWETGHFVVRGLTSIKEIRSWQEECRRVWDSVELTEDNPRLHWRDRVSGERVADRIDPLLDISPVFKRLTGDARLVRSAADLIGGDTDVFKACLISKRPGTTGDGLHQDFPRWSDTGNSPPDEFVNVLMPIDPFNLDNGAIELFPGYHRQRLEGPTGEPGDESQIDLSKGVVLTLNPGDFVLFHGLIPHRSGPNRTPRNRESLFITYVRSKR
jgi:ectoine hydroxylase-related dioxygenase (phytanoyl-CoA dioxygenase family)